MWRCSGRRIPRLIVRSIVGGHDWSHDRSFMATASRTIFSNRSWSRDRAYDQSYCKVPTYINILILFNYIKLGVRSLANASRARQFNPLNPPGVGWVNLFIYFLRWEYLSAHACQIWARSVAKDFFTIYNPLNPPGVGWVNILIFFKVRVSIRTCVQNLGAIRRERFLTIYNPLNPPGVGWVKMFRWELIWPISSHPIKMWARSDGRFEKSVLQVYNRMPVKDAHAEREVHLSR